MHSCLSEASGYDLLWIFLSVIDAAGIICSLDWPRPPAPVLFGRSCLRFAMPLTQKLFYPRAPLLVHLRLFSDKLERGCDLRVFGENVYQPFQNKTVPFYKRYVARFELGNTAVL